MKKTVIAFFLFAATPVVAQLPDLYLYDMNNQFQSLPDRSGEKLTVVDFWATWCKPCLLSIPELIKLNNEYRDKGVNFIGINIDSPRNQSKIKPFSNSSGINYPVLLDPDQEAMKEMNVVFVPTLLIYNSDGEVVFSHEGFKPGDQDVIRDELNKHLNE